MRIVKERVTHIPGAEHSVWTTTFKEIIEAIVEANSEDLQAEFVKKYLKEFEDVRYYTYGQIAYVFLLFGSSLYILTSQ